MGFPTKIDEIYGPDTALSVLGFKKHVGGIPGNGDHAGPATIDALERALAVKGITTLPGTTSPVRPPLTVDLAPSGGGTPAPLDFQAISGPVLGVVHGAVARLSGSAVALGAGLALAGVVIWRLFRGRR